MVKQIKVEPTKISRDGALLMEALHEFVPEAIQLPVRVLESRATTCYKRIVPMFFVPIAAGGYHGLFIETNVVEAYRDKRECYAEFLRDAGYRYIEPMPWHKALEEVLTYIHDAQPRFHYDSKRRYGPQKAHLTAIK